MGCLGAVLSRLLTHGTRSKALQGYMTYACLDRLYLLAGGTKVDLVDGVMLAGEVLYVVRRKLGRVHVDVRA